MTTYVMRPPRPGASAAAVLRKQVITNPNGYARIEDDIDLQQLKAAGWTVASIAVEPEAGKPQLRKDRW